MEGSPHIAFANLSLAAESDGGGDLIDPEAMLSFTRKYGFLSGTLVEGIHRQRVARCLRPEPNVMRERSDARDRILRNPYALLRYAWKSKDEIAIAELRRQAARGLKPQVPPFAGTVVIDVKNVWGLICLLFLRDYAEAKSTMCANPSCAAPFFVKTRKTQRICGSGDCVSWAQRTYALKWWRENESKQAIDTKKGRT